MKGIVQEKTNCPLCFESLKERKDKVYFLCLNCGGLVMDTEFRPLPDEEKKRYEEHNNDVEDLRYQKFTSPITNFILANYATHTLGLDFGSGTGPVISKVLTDKGYRILLYDPFFAPFEENLNHSFDYIVCCEVMEHFHQPFREFKRLFHILKSGGRLVCMTWCYNETIPFKNWSYRNDKTHVFIYQSKTLAYIAEQFNAVLELEQERLVVFKKR